MPKKAVWPVALGDMPSPPLRARGNQVLSRIERVVDWKPIEKALRAIGSMPTGRPRYPPMLLFRILLLQRWYGLSDPAAEYAVQDRQSFARFVGLPANAPAPNYKTIWRFRSDLARLGLLDTLPASVQQMIEASGLVLREGAMVEASLITV